MSAHVLLNLLDEFGKRDKMQGLLSILFLFCKEFNRTLLWTSQRFLNIYKPLVVY